MVGDRIDTDIAFGRSGGVSTLLVLSGEVLPNPASLPYPVLTFFIVVLRSGVSKESDLEADNKPLAIPDYIIKSLGDMAVLGT